MLADAAAARGGRADSVGATVSIIGFAFYLQPIAMPMLREMPPGEVGYKILSFCMRTVILGALRLPSLAGSSCTRASRQGCCSFDPGCSELDTTCIGHTLPGQQKGCTCHPSAYTRKGITHPVAIPNPNLAGFAFTIYFLLGFFGAARWGANTQGDLLENVWGPGPYQGTLNTLLGIYLAFTMPPICYPTAHVVKARARSPRLRVRAARSWSARLHVLHAPHTSCDILVSSLSLLAGDYALYGRPYAGTTGQSCVEVSTACASARGGWQASKSTHKYVRHIICIFQHKL